MVARFPLTPKNKQDKSIDSPHRIVGGGMIFGTAYSQGRRKESRVRGSDRSKRAPTTLGQQIYPRNGGHPRHLLGNIMGYASHSHINDCLFQSNIACF